MKFYNIVKIKHEDTIDKSCNCNVRSLKASVEVLFENVSEDEITTFKNEIKEAITRRTMSSFDALSKVSNFRGQTYTQLLVHYKSSLAKHLNILEILTV